MICSSIDELNALALKKIEEKLEGVSEIPEYYQYTKFLMKKAGESRKARDPEKTYLFLLMYMYIIKRKLPEYKEEIASNPNFLGEYKYNVGKLDNVKNELTKFKEYLIQAYDNEDDVPVDVGEISSDESYEEEEVIDDDYEETPAPKVVSKKQSKVIKKPKKSKPTPKKRKFKPRPLPGMDFPQPMVETPVKPKRVIKYDDDGNITTINDLTPSSTKKTS
mmetsp:Transcript_6788/g.9894  ORF Transcript_6788/g.9894 Transcript_6788/m.9894 type:complete len:220 (+) Transcript_6788:72-731(+)